MLQSTVLEHCTLSARDNEVPTGVEPGGGRGGTEVAHLPPGRCVENEHLPRHLVLPCRRGDRRFGILSPRLLSSQCGLELLCGYSCLGSLLPSHHFALIYAGLGQKDEAFEWLEKAYQERSSYLLYMKSYPSMVPLRSDPRFQDLAGRIGLVATEQRGRDTLARIVAKPPSQ